jgi:para-nitrobenzyl esterase
VETTTGRVEGREKDGVLLFAGIPYAAPPIGPRRFRPPEPHPGWTGVRDATRFGPMAMQPEPAAPPGVVPKPITVSEDCLLLNVQTPATTGGPRPVLVWVHGGGFNSGGSSMPRYDGAALARNGDAVVVSINYRLGLLGWLHLAELDADYAGSGNLGLLDQTAALEWVHHNAASFGGDPDDVTLFGQSAGAMSIVTLLSRPDTTPYVRRAIAQSGAANATRSCELAVEQTDIVLRHLDGSSVDDITGADADRLLEAERAANFVLPRPPSSPVPFGPVVDGEVLVRQPLDAIRDGAGRDVPLIVGTTHDEFSWAGMARPVKARDDVARLCRPWCDPSNSVAEAYLDAFGEDYQQARDTLLTDHLFRMPAVALAEARSGAAPTYMYRFDWAEPGRPLGAMHSAEVPFVFHNIDRPAGQLLAGPHAPRALADAVHHAWLGFARSGDPNHGGLPLWEPYTSERRTTLLFDEPCRIEVDPDATLRLAWASDARAAAGA